MHEKVLTDHSEKIDFFVRTSLPPVEGIFYDGQIFDAYTFATDLIKSAKNTRGRNFTHLRIIREKCVSL